MQSVRYGQTFLFTSFNLEIGILPLFDKEKVSYRWRKNTTPWWTEEVRVAVKQKIICFRMWMKTRSDDRQSYITARNSTERVKKLAKLESWKVIGEDLKKDMEGTKKILFSLTKSYRGRNNEL